MYMYKYVCVCVCVCSVHIFILLSLSLSLSLSQAPHSVLLITILNNITINNQPDVFFSFSGGHGSVSSRMGGAYNY